MPQGRSFPSITGSLMVRADCQESAQRARQCEAGCHEHHDAKASHEGFVQILFERRRCSPTTCGGTFASASFGTSASKATRISTGTCNRATCVSSADLEDTSGERAEERDRQHSSNTRDALLMPEAVPKCCSLTAPMILKRRYLNPKTVVFRRSRPTRKITEFHGVFSS